MSPRPGNQWQWCRKWKLWRTWRTASAPVTVCLLRLFSSSWQLPGTWGGSCQLEPARPRHTPEPWRAHRGLNLERPRELPDTTVIPSINVCHFKTAPEENFLAFKRGFAFAARKKNLKSRGGYKLFLFFVVDFFFFCTIWHKSTGHLCLYLSSQCSLKINLILLARLHAHPTNVQQKKWGCIPLKMKLKLETFLPMPNSSICHWIRNCLAGWQSDAIRHI